MNRTGIPRFTAAIVAFGVALAMSSSALADIAWDYLPIAAGGCATSLSAWRNGDTWITGCGSSGDNMVSELIRSTSQPEQFQQRNFKAKQVAVDPASNTGTPPTVWALTTAGAIYLFPNAGSQSFVKYFSQPSCTRAIGVGWNKTVWIIECDNTVAYLNSSGTFTSKGAGPETLAKVAVPLNGGNPWFIAQSGNIYMYNNSWNKEPGCATSISIGGDGVPWIVGCSSNSSGNVYRWNGSAFSQVVVPETQVNLKLISVSYENIPWGTATLPNGLILERTAELYPTIYDVPQMESEWCWAASSQSIYNYLDNGAHASTQQCDLVNGVLKRSDCCNSNQPCNQPGLDTNMFNYLGIHYQEQNGIISFEGLVSNLSTNSPVNVYYDVVGSSVGHMEVAEGVYVDAGIQYIDRWNPEPVGVGTDEWVTYPTLIQGDNLVAGGFTQAIHF